VGTGDSPVQVLPAVRDLNFSIAPGSPRPGRESGSGKSITSLAIMAAPAAGTVSGEILFAENGSARNLATLPDDSMRQLRGSRLAMIFQEPMTALNPSCALAIRSPSRDGSRLRFKKRGPENAPSKP